MIQQLITTARNKPQDLVEDVIGIASLALLMLAGLNIPSIF